MERGNFLSVINLLSNYDPVLKELTEKPESEVKYLHHDIQNELIQLISEQVKKTILNDVTEASFYSIILDTTPDITRVDKLSVVFRYVKILIDESGKPTDLKVNESFMGFVSVRNHTASGLKDFILDFFQKNNINLGKCRGQAYDGARVMSGAYNGLQAQIEKLEENAKYIHCARTILISYRMMQSKEFLKMPIFLTFLTVFLNFLMRVLGGGHCFRIPVRTFLLEHSKGYVPPGGLQETKRWQLLDLGTKMY